MHGRMKVPLDSCIISYPVALDVVRAISISRGDIDIILTTSYDHPSLAQHGALQARPDVLCNRLGCGTNQPRLPHHLLSVSFVFGL